MKISRVQGALGKLLTDPEALVRYRALRVIAISKILVEFFQDDIQRLTFDKGSEIRGGGHKVSDRDCLIARL